MPIKGRSIYSQAEGPQIIEPQVQRPSSFLTSMTDGKHTVLPNVLDTKIPVIDQERYERQVFILSAQITGTGAAIGQFKFDPAPPFPSFRVRRLYVRNEPTSARWWVLRAYKQSPTVPTGVGAVTMAMVRMGTNSNRPLVETNAQAMFDTAGLATHSFWSSPLDFYRGVRGDKQEGAGSREYFDVTSLSNITAVDTVDMYAECEVLEPLAAWDDFSSKLSNSPP